jgi:hypothetical protein
VPVVGDQDLFEQRYTSRFRDRLVEHGLFIKYENDRAAIDLGLHLFDPAQTPGTVGSVRVWFQLKGIRASSLSPEQLDEHDSVAVGGLSVDHIRYWFAHPERCISRVMSRR